MNQQEPQQSSPKKKKLRAIFSDIDGTIVHYDAKLKKQGYELVDIVEVEEGNTNNKSPSSSSFDKRVHIWKHTATGRTVRSIPVPSATLGGGFISLATMSLVQKLRQERDVKFCLLTGARTSTFLSRVYSGALPKFDFGVCEGGGKIYSSSKNDGACNDEENSLILDEDWINSFSKSIGDWKSNRDKFPENPENREGALWNLYKRLKTENGLLLQKNQEKKEEEEKQISGGFPKLDATSFDSAFMVDLRQLHQPTTSSTENTNTNSTKPTLLVCGVDEVNELEQGLKKIVTESDEYKDLLTVCINLGKGHVSAKGCTKADVVKYLTSSESKKIQPPIKLFSSSEDKEEETTENDNEIVAGMFDDENDLDFVKLCHIGFAPGIAHPSVEKFLQNHLHSQQQEKQQPRYRKCNIEGFLGTEEALEYLLENYC